MRRVVFRWLWSIAVLFALPPAALAAVPPSVVTADIRGGIGPPTATYVQRVLEHARDTKAALIVFSIDTPGGLDTSMREIIQAVLASPVPVAMYVAPRGARAASAGTYLLYASHVAAMAPGTNTGAATPVAIGIGGDRGGKDKEAADDGKAADKRGASEQKAIRDAIAYLKSLAELRGRNASWAEKAVLEGDSLPASEALKLNVVDVVAVDVADLLRQLEGRKVAMHEREQVLQLTGARLDPVEPNWKERLLAIIANPNVALLLMLAGVYGLLFEFYLPGTGLPGVLGGICLVLGLYGLAMLPVNVAGVALLLLGLALMLAEAFLPSFGVLGIGGLVAFALGGMLLIDADIPGFSISWEVIAPIVVANALVIAMLGAFALRSRHRPVVSGAEAMIGGLAEAMEDFEHEGWVQAAGERWRARSLAPVVRGQRLVVTGRVGLMLSVEPFKRGGGQ